MQSLKMENKIFEIVFKSLKNEKYVIIKSFDPIDFSKGNDIDIFCYSIIDIKKNIINSLDKLLDETSIEISVKNYHKHSHLDILEKNNILIRFDLFEDIPNYKKLNIRSSLFDIILEKRVIKKFRSTNYYIADSNFNNLIRYIEYIEYFTPENNKIKHLIYLENNLKNDFEFYNNIHYYIKFPYEKTKPNRGFRKTDFNQILKKVKETKTKDLPKKIFNFLFR